MPNSDLMEIFEKGDLDALVDLLKKNGDENDSDSEDASRESFDPNERDDYRNPTYLHVAVSHGYEDIVKLLLKLNDIEPNVTADYTGEELFVETNPLHLAIHGGENAIAKLLIDHKSTDVNDSGSDPDGLSPLQYALMCRETQIVKMLIAADAEKLRLDERPLPSEKRTLIQVLNEENGFENFTLRELFELGVIDPDSLDTTNDDGYTLLEVAAQEDNVEHAELLIRYGAEVTADVYNLANNDVKALLDYRPGKNQQSIYQYCLGNNHDLEQRKRLILDYEDTTDAESSDDEDYADADITLTKDESAHILKERERLVTAHNQGNHAEKKKLQMLTFRGFHHDPSYFSPEKRQESRADLAAGKSAISYATFKASGYDADDEVDETSKQFATGHQKVKKFFADMRGKADHKETDAPTRNKKTFENLYFRFVQAYVENYNQLFNEGAVEKDFGFDTTHNPAVSTTYLPDKAMKYASGMRNQKGADIHRLNPHYRRTTGKAKHPHLGFTDVFAIDIDYVKKNGAHILELVHQGKIGISHIKQFECEILFESMIPGQYHVHREVFSLPNFDGIYQEKYQEKYGLSKLIFNRFKEKIRDREYPRNSNGELEILNALIEQIVAHLGMKLKEKMEAKLYKENPINPEYAVFPFRDGKLKTIAVSPKEKAQWRKVDQTAAAATVDDLNDEFSIFIIEDDKKMNR